MGCQHLRDAHKKIYAEENCLFSHHGKLNCAFFFYNHSTFYKGEALGIVSIIFILLLFYRGRPIVVSDVQDE